MKDELLEIPLNQIQAKNNYRKTFNEKSLKELAASIKENGVIEPIVVRRVAEDFYNIIAGERRFRASEMAGLVTIPAIVKTVAEDDVLLLQIVENIQREGVQFMEEARALRQMRDEMALDVAEIARMIGKSDALVHNLLLLTKMSSVAQDAANKGELGKEVAVYIARLPNDEFQNKAATALRRSEKSKLISGRVARQYIEDTFGAKRVSRAQRNRIQKQNGNDYQSNWKKYLVNFSSLEFEKFKKVLRGRTETSVIAEAVEAVMLEMAETVE